MVIVVVGYWSQRWNVNVKYSPHPLLFAKHRNMSLK